MALGVSRALLAHPRRLAVAEGTRRPFFSLSIPRGNGGPSSLSLHPHSARVILRGNPGKSDGGVVIVGGERIVGGSALRPRRRPGTLAASGRSTCARNLSNASSKQSKRQTSTSIHIGQHGAASAPPTAGGGGVTGKEMVRSLGEALNAALLKPRTVPLPRWISPRHFSITMSECFGHASFILVAASYATDDFLMLRTIAVVGSTSMLVFTYFHPHGKVLWLPLKWNLLFIAINSYRIGKVVLDRYKARQLNDELMRVYTDHFYVMDVVDFAKLVNLGTEEVYEPGDLIVGQGSMNRSIRLVIEGELNVLRDSVHTYNLEEGNFVSESGLHAGLLLPGAVESCVSIVAGGDGRSKDSSSVGKKPRRVRTLRWDRTELMELLQKNKGLRRSLKAALSWDIVRKLKAQRYLLASGRVEDPALWTIKRNNQNDKRYAAILQNLLQRPDYMNEHRDELNKYRIIHHIDDEHHRQALEQCGWTPEEFELGRRLLEDEDDALLEEDAPQTFRLARFKYNVTNTLSSMFG